MWAFSDSGNLRNPRRITPGPVSPPDPQADGLVFIVHPPQARDVRNLRMEVASRQAFVHPHIRYCLVMALPAEDSDLNYDAAALFQVTATDSNPISVM